MTNDAPFFSLRRNGIFLPVLLGLAFLLLPIRLPASDSENQVFPVPAPPFSENIFPCSDCHDDLEINTTPRKLADEHQDIQFNHADRISWCFDCHDAANRDRLRLASGATIPFTQSYLLCGQCHGTIYRDWRAGVHGKRTGFWNGRKQYLLCAHCHNPHTPKFKPLRPEPPPMAPRSFSGKAPTWEKRHTDK